MIPCAQRDLDATDIQAVLEVIGIKPGEKLHEVMITSDDAINTLEFDDMYVIEPAFHWWDEIANSDNWIADGKAMPEGFQYSSDLDDWWLSKDELDRLAGIEKND